MLLATTADQRFWKTDEKILFLGEWCRLYSQKQVWSKLDHEVFPYHWDDRQKLYQDYQFLDEIYETCLPQLAGQLNELHDTDCPTRYWRIVVGPWLFNFIQILYDRYLSICAVERSEKATHVLLPNPGSTNWVANNFIEFKGWAHTDPFNQYLYAEIIRSSGKIHFQTTRSQYLAPHENHEATSQKPFTRITQDTLRKLAHILPDKMKEMVFVNSYIKPLELCRLQLSLGQLPNLYPPNIKSGLFSKISTMRDKIKIALSSEAFETLLQTMIPSLLPTVYVEGYQDIHHRALEAFPEKPKVIYTTNALFGNEGFTFWAAWHTMRGTKLVTSQHGGHYGISKWSAQETHELKVSDKNFTWGWGDGVDLRIVPMASGQLKTRTRNLKANADGNILWVGMMVPRYSYWLYSAPIGAQALEYFEDQKCFAEEVSSQVSNLLVYRMPGHDFGWDQQERLTDMIPSVKLYGGPKSFYQQLNQARLCVNTCNSTPYLETFAANFPTLLFWNPNHWEIRPSAQPYFDELRDAGILHDTPESAALKINEIYKDPAAWWFSSSIQKAREGFCHKFARISSEWISEWTAELNKITEG